MRQKTCGSGNRRERLFIRPHRFAQGDSVIVTRFVIVTSFVIPNITVILMSHVILNAVKNM